MGLARRRITRTVILLAGLAGGAVLGMELCRAALIAFFTLAPRLTAPREPAAPFPGGLPDREIVFAPDAAPDALRREARTLGFVHPDGSSRLERTFPLRTGFHSVRLSR